MSDNMINNTNNTDMSATQVLSNDNAGNIQLAQIDKRKSKQIFDTLMNGRIINKHLLNNSSETIDNPLFSEIMDNLDAYQNWYDACGYELITKPTFVYLNDAVQDPKTELTMKAYCLLLIIGKYLTMNNFTLSKITDPKSGLTIEDFQKMADIPNVADILGKTKIAYKKDEDMFSAVKSILVDRHIMLEKASSKKFVLSDAGKAFYEELMAKFDDGDTFEDNTLK